MPSRPIGPATSSCGASSASRKRPSWLRVALWSRWRRSSRARAARRCDRSAAWTIDYVSHVPGGAQPSYAHCYTVRDNDFYVAWDAISRDRDTFLEWMEDNVLGA